MAVTERILKDCETREPAPGELASLGEAVHGEDEEIPAHDQGKEIAPAEGEELVVAQARPGAPNSDEGKGQQRKLGQEERGTKKDDHEEDAHG
jgi:hypothetical protein